MKLQLALDDITMEQGLKVAEEVKDLIDILELGTPFCYANPIGAIRIFKEALQGVKILADYKIMDGGYGIAKMAYEAGADLTTVSGRTWDDTIRQAISAARDYGKEILVDMMGVPDDKIAQRGAELDEMGADYICIHRAVSVASSTSPEEPLRILRETVSRTKVAVAGGLNCETLKKAVLHRPDLVIVGSSIAKAEDPRAVVLEMKQIMQG
ncbi:orotidine 5'-phosphate decarboxylase / HUMPS family protein [Anaerolentibacter hominis]|uniref:orotidine 5'-phosphate decarboxylase / HUMPS family protein n=1 Tax=Anaerolentibacter hominis TaxID=3079009 RepID=UPI0031B8B1A9